MQKNQVFLLILLVMFISYILFFKMHKKNKIDKTINGDWMPYFSYHGRNKKLIKEGMLIDYFYEIEKGEY